jgi:hypothetical protein
MQSEEILERSIIKYHQLSPVEQRNNEMNADPKLKKLLYWSIMMPVLISLKIKTPRTAKIK